MKLGICRWDSPVGSGGRLSMSGLRYDRILAGTALALILAAPTSAHATSQIDSASKLAAVPTANANATPGSQAPAASPPAPAAALPAASDPAGAAADVLDIVVTPAAPTVPDVTGTAVAPAAAVPAAAAPNAGTPAVAPEPATAVEQSPPPDPLASLDPADRPVAEKINDLLASQERQDLRQQERTHCRRNLLPHSQPAAAVARQRQRERAAPGRSSPA